jgi:two-component sensor histidine kinase
MHATIPELDGTILDAPRFNCALGRSENLFKAMADVCLTDGRGYVDYLWPKPTENGMTDEVPKLSYVELFEPWGWVVGTGLYIDDIERDANERLEAVIKELQISFSQVKVAQTGYMFLFTGEQEMLVHPYLEGADFSKLLNPETGNPVLADLIEAAHTPSQRLLYTWDKPPEFEGLFEFKKMAFVYYFEPLDWYLASSVYSDETESTASEVRLRVMTLGLLILLVGVVLSFWLSSGISRPLLRLTKAAKYIHSHSDLHNRVPIMGTVETKELGIVLNRMLASLQEEISERRQTELTLKDALQEKEVLLKEVHHRVKNNMAVVISMLNMQSKRVNNDMVRLALEESRSRISAMSLIHEALYRSDNLAEIHLRDYVSNVFNALQQTMVQVHGGVVFTMAGDTVNLPIDQAVPCGLVLNELITNSLKYGYPNGGPGVINLVAHVENNNWVQLDYSDDGIGLPENYDPSIKNTLGMRIVKLLVENQLGGELSWINGPGAHFIIRWPTEFIDNVEL